MQQNASPAYNSTIAEGVNLTNTEVSEVALHLMADFSGDQAADFIKKLAKAHCLPVAVFSEADVENVYDVRRRMDIDDNTISNVPPITYNQTRDVMTNSRWVFMDDTINEPGLKVIADLVDEL